MLRQSWTVPLLLVVFVALTGGAQAVFAAGDDGADSGVAGTAPTAPDLNESVRTLVTAGVQSGVSGAFEGDVVDVRVTDGGTAST